MSVNRSRTKTGSITKLVSSFGSTWGLIKPVGQDREVFFNQEAFDDPSGYCYLAVGEEVNFDEEEDRANGTRAIHISSQKAPLTAG